MVEVSKQTLNAARLKAFRVFRQHVLVCYLVHASGGRLVEVQLLCDEFHLGRLKILPSKEMMAA